MLEGPNFTGMKNSHVNFLDVTQRFHQVLDEMPIEILHGLQMSNNGGSLARSTVNSSVDSNDSKTQMLSNHNLNPISVNYTTYESANNGGRVSKVLDEDLLAKSLMDVRVPAIGLKSFEEWTINLSKLTIGPSFARGAFGKLYKGTYNDKNVAIKLLEKPEDNVDRANLMQQQFQQEVMMLSRLNHPNIVRFIGACYKPMVWCIVTEYAKGGSVRQFLNKRKNRSVPLKLAVKQALDVAKGMEYVHGLGLIHRDLKSDNLLIASDRSILIADFGVARIMVQTEGMTPEMGTYRWMAPEMIQHRPYTQKVDVYSFGIVLWELITGMLPFQNLTDVQAAFAVVSRGIRPTVPNDCLPVLREIMTRCWDGDPDARPNFTQVVKMLEMAETEIVTNVRNARFRHCCVGEPMTLD